MNKLWKRFRLWAYKKNMKLMLKIGVFLAVHGTTDDRLKVLKLFHQRMNDTIHKEYPNDKELKKIWCSLVGYSLGISTAEIKILKKEMRDD